MTAFEQRDIDARDEEARDLRVSGVLTFIMADLTVFALLFVSFLVDRHKQLDLFIQSAFQLDIWLGLLNTLILVTSGLFVVFAVRAAERGVGRITRRWLLCSFLVGAGFGVNKVLEYSAKLDQGFTMLSNDFYMYYYVLTFTHFLHFLGGMAALSFLWFTTGSGRVSKKQSGNIEAVALYWHMVDLLWIFIFPLLYLLRS